MNDSSPHRCNAGLGSRYFGTLALASASLGLACGSERLSLGAGEALLEPGESACGGGVVHGEVEVHDQPGLEALAGCEEVVGNLWIHAFAGVDLRPLSSLRIVRGDLAIGPNDSGFELFESLEGLEALEQVSRLSIYYLGATDLSPLSNLKRVELDPQSPWDEGGSIDIESCPNLVDLTGLGGLEQWTQLFMQGNDSLESLNGLGLPSLGRPSVLGQTLPALRDLSALAGLESADWLRFSDTGLEHVAPLGLQAITGLDFMNNDALVDIDGFADLEVVDNLTVMDNAALERLPEWPALRRLSDVQIVNNAALESIPAYVTQTLDGYFSLGSDYSIPSNNPDVLQPHDFTMFEVGGNPKLTSLTLPTGLARGQYIGVYDNPSLLSLNLSSITKLDQLSIRNNAVLANVGLGGLEAVDELAVEDNPMLPSETFADVASFKRVIDGNAGDPP
jgi:hypothetical protein